ncbi:unnamed protein product [Closterium sp. NIES-54]
MGAAREEACAGHFILLSSVPYPHSLPLYSPPLQTDKATLLGEVVDVLRALHFSPPIPSTPIPPTPQPPTPLLPPSSYPDGQSNTPRRGGRRVAGAARGEACAGHFILLSSVPYPHSLPLYSPPLQTDKATLLGEVVDVLRALHAERHAEGEATEGERRGV